MSYMASARTRAVLPCPLIISGLILLLLLMIINMQLVVFLDVF